MRFLIVGAGATGGYFGGRLSKKGEDVTFLVRETRKNQLLTNSLVVKSIHGDIHTTVKAITSGEDVAPFDVVIITVKAYHLNEVIIDLKPYIGDKTVIIPILNGYAHYETLRGAFGQEKILGGICFVETTLNENGEIVQTSRKHDLVFGEWEGSISARAELIHQHLQEAGFPVVVSETIQNDIWNKYIFIATVSGVTTLMRSPIGPILADSNGNEICQSLLNEIVTIAARHTKHLKEDTSSMVFNRIKACEFKMKSSMQRDMEKNNDVEADHFHGVLLQLAEKQGMSKTDFPILKTVYSNLKIYESLQNAKS